MEFGATEEHKHQLHLAENRGSTCSTLIMTEAVELNVAWKLALVGAAQGPSALSGVCELAKTSGVRKLVCCLSFLS